MNTDDVKSDLPDNYGQLKTAVNRPSDWKARLEAVEELGKWKNKQVIDVLTHRMNNDTVYRVQEAAYRKLAEWGEAVELPPKKKGELVKGTAKILTRIKKSLPEGHLYAEFKEKLKKTRLDLYDVYEGDKGEQFEQWLEDQWASLSKDRTKQ